MRNTLAANCSRLALLLSATVLLVVGGLLGLRSEPSFANRDAFVAALGRGDRHLPVARMTYEWRGDIAAQEALLRQDRRLGAVLALTGLMALFGAVARTSQRSSSEGAA